MAERIDSISPRRAGGRPRIYPWETWTDGSCWRLQRGEDFQMPAGNMARLIRARGRRYDMPVKVSENNELGTVEFQFLVEPPERAAAA
jgi:hypothetical protein